MKQNSYYFLTGCKLTLLSTICNWAYAQELAPVSSSEPSKAMNVSTLPVIKVMATKKISFDGPKTIIQPSDMTAFGDQSVNDTLQRTLGLLNFNDGKSSRSVFGSYTILINGDHLQSSSRGNSPLLDTLTPTMIDKIEIIKQPSVAYSNQNSLGIINIILKTPTANINSGLVKVGYGYIDINNNTEEKTLLNLQFDSKNEKLSYGATLNATNDQIKFRIRTKNQTTSSEQEKTAEPRAMVITSKAEYQLTEQSKLGGDIYYRNSGSDLQMGNTTQTLSTEHLVSNVRYEHKNADVTHKFRLWGDVSDSSLRTLSNFGNSYSPLELQSYSFNYDQQRKLSTDLQLKLGTSVRTSSIADDQDEFEEVNTAFYTEGTWRFTPKQSFTLGLRQELLNRSGLDESDHHSLGGIGSYSYQLSPEMQMQVNIKKSSITPHLGQVSLFSRRLVDNDNGTLNNPEAIGNPFLKPEEIQSVELNLDYKTKALTLELNPFYKEINNYIENTIVLENQKYYLRPENQDKAKLTGINLNGKFAFKETSTGHNFRLTGQLSTIRAVVSNKDSSHYRAYGVSPYSYNLGLVHDYKPLKITSSINFSYLPEYTRIVPSDIRYAKQTGAQKQLDFNLTKELSKNTTLAFVIRNILISNQKSAVINRLDNTVLEQREVRKAPNFLVTVERKF